MERKDIENIAKSRSFFKRYKKEFFLFICVFIGVCLGLFTSIPLITDFSYQEEFIHHTGGEKVKGNAIAQNMSFVEIFANNLNVNLLMFIIGFLLYSGIVFILTWNASVIVYYLYNIGSYEKIILTSLLIFPHGIIEIAGYILAGLAGAILSFRLDNAFSSRFYKISDREGNISLKPDRRNTFNKLLNKKFTKDILVMICFSISLILLGAIIETV